MNRITSKDGTSIACERIGEGPALVLVDGALCYRASGPNKPLAERLASSFTVYTYDRRGRGDSENRGPYAIEREVEDLEAVIAAAGGTAYVYGISSGAALALAAAARLSCVRKLALFEAPFIVDGSRALLPTDYSATMDALLASGKRGAAIKHFLGKGVGVPGPIVAMMPLMPGWSKMKAVAHTLPYDVKLTIDYQRGEPLPAETWRGVTIPTLVLDGGKSPAWMRSAMSSLADALPNADYRTLPDQTHIVKPDALAPALKQFFYKETDLIPAP